MEKLVAVYGLGTSISVIKWRLKMDPGRAYGTSDLGPVTTNRIVGFLIGLLIVSRLSCNGGGPISLNFFLLQRAPTELGFEACWFSISRNHQAFMWIELDVMVMRIDKLISIFLKKTNATAKYKMKRENALLHRKCKI